MDVVNHVRGRQATGRESEKKNCDAHIKSAVVTVF